MTSLSDDAAALSRALERTTGPVVLVGHAYSGAVIAAVREDRVKSLVYIAALLAIGIALIPMPWDCKRHSFSLHGFCAVSFFLCIAFVSAICPRDTLILIKDPKVRARYQKTYVPLAIAMILSPIAAYAFNFVTSQRSPVFWSELFGIYAFAGYWCVKTKEMSGPDIKRIMAEFHEQAAV